MKSITIDLPQELLTAYGSESAACQALTQLAILDLVRRGHLSLPQGAQFLKVSLSDFIRLLATTALPVPPETTSR